MSSLALECPGWRLLRLDFGQLTSDRIATILWRAFRCENRKGAVRVGFRTKGQLGAWIASERDARSISQRELAAAVGVDPSAMSRIESGRRGLAISELMALSQFLGVDVDAILRDDEPALAFRADEDAEVDQALAVFSRHIDDYLAFRAAAR